MTSEADSVQPFVDDDVVVVDGVVAAAVDFVDAVVGAVAAAEGVVAYVAAVAVAVADDVDVVGAAVGDVDAVDAAVAFVDFVDVAAADACDAFDENDAVAGHLRSRQHSFRYPPT